MEGRLDWLHVWPRQLRAGAPMWVAFHTRDPGFDVAGAALELVVESTGGVALSARVVVARSPLTIASVSFVDDGRTLVAHVTNVDDVPHIIAHLAVLDRDVDDTACLADRELRPGDTALLTAPLCTPATPGDPWTILVDVDDGTAGVAPAVAGGRVMPSFFPIEAWPKSRECPFPVDGPRPELWPRHRDAGIDTLFM